MRMVEGLEKSGW